MYCDFCGNKLSYKVRYCRKCGRQLKDYAGDTQPIPIIDETMLRSNKPQALTSRPWYKFNFTKKTPTTRSAGWRTMYCLASVAIIAGFLYILTIFKTVKEYQIFTTVMGSLWAIYIWWKR